MGHINVAELDAVLKGVNLALKWGLKDISVMTDSSTVLSWLCSVPQGDFRAKVSRMSEMLLKSQLLIVKELVHEYGLVITPTHVKSCKNKG